MQLHYQMSGGTNKREYPSVVLFFMYIFLELQ